MIPECPDMWVVQRYHEGMGWVVAEWQLEEAKALEYAKRFGDAAHVVKISYSWAKRMQNIAEEQLQEVS